VVAALPRQAIRAIRGLSGATIQVNTLHLQAFPFQPLVCRALKMSAVEKYAVPFFAHDWNLFRAKGRIRRADSSIQSTATLRLQ
jgi:hypothetical protein